MRRKFISVHCPSCGFNNGGFYEGDVTPTRPMSFVCRRDRYYVEKDKKMYDSPNHCGAKWDQAVTEDQYQEMFEELGKRIVIEKLNKELE